MKLNLIKNLWFKEKQGKQRRLTCKMKSLIVILLIISVKLCVSVREWNEIPSSTDVGFEPCQPIPKEGANCVMLDDEMVCAHGYFPCFSQADCGQSNVYQDKIFTFNPVTNRWTCNEPPTPGLTGDRVFAAMWSRESSNEIYFFGGVNILCGGIPVFPVKNDLWKVNMGSNTWTNLTATMIGTPGSRLGPGYAKLSDDLFLLVGGLNGFFGAENDVWIYNVSANAWTQIQASLNNDTLRPHGRFNAQFVCNSDDSTFPLCVLSFGDTLENTPLNDVWTFNKFSYQWTRIAATADASETQPGDRVQFCAFLKQKDASKLYLYVGFGDADDAPRCDNAVTGYGDNPSRAHWVIRVDVAGGSWSDVTDDVIGDARETKSCACVQTGVATQPVAYMNFGHKFTCPNGSNSTGFPLPNERVLKWRIPNP